MPQTLASRQVFVLLRVAEQAFAVQVVGLAEVSGQAIVVHRQVVAVAAAVIVRQRVVATQRAFALLQAVLQVFADRTPLRNPG